MYNTEHTQTEYYIDFFQVVVLNNSVWKKKLEIVIVLECQFLILSGVVDDMRTKGATSMKTSLHRQQQRPGRDDTQNHYCKSEAVTASLGSFLFLDSHLVPSMKQEDQGSAWSFPRQEHVRFKILPTI